MREIMTAAGLMPPVFESDRGADLFTARYYFHHFLGTEDVAWLARFKEFHLSTEEARALILLREQGAIDNATYRGINHVDTLGASKSLRRLRDAGVLEQKEKGSATYYRPAGAFWALEEVAAEAPSQPLPPVAVAVPTLDEALSTKSTGLSPMISGALPAHLLATVAKLGSRSAIPDIQQVVLQLCALAPRTVGDLSILLSRTPKHVYRVYLRPLIDIGQLSPTIPDEPNHPKQAYRTVLSER